MTTDSDFKNYFLIFLNHEMSLDGSSIPLLSKLNIFVCIQNMLWFSCVFMNIENSMCILH